VKQKSKPVSPVKVPITKSTKVPFIPVSTSSVKVPFVPVSSVKVPFVPTRIITKPVSPVKPTSQVSAPTSPIKEMTSQQDTELRKKIINTLKRISDLEKRLGEKYKSKAFLDASRAFELYDGPLIESNVRKIPKVGASSADVIMDIIYHSESKR